MFENKTILVAPLGWGLGHASRCVPLIAMLLKKNRVIIACPQQTENYFERYFPEAEKIFFPSFNIVYSKRLPQWIKVGLQLPRILLQIAEEKKQTSRLIRTMGIDVLISDNRYGVYSKFVQSVFITHQLNVRVPGLSRMAGLLHRKLLRKFCEIWVPDFEDQSESLAGWLSHANGRLRIKYIGPLSALSHLPAPANGKQYDYLLLLSGPEPQRTIFENLLLDRFRNSSARVALVRGTLCPLNPPVFSPEHVVDLASGSALKDLILSSKTIICRSGYSTLMDLFLLGKTSLVLVPTPGQPEQEFLAAWWEKSRGTRTVRQNKISRLEI